MDQYLSTYRKDFLWPYVKSFPIRTEKRAYRMPDYQSQCICGAEPGGSMPPKEYVGPPAVDYQWSRLGPMAPLLDPKLYPAKVGPAPEFEITRHGQPNTYLKKLEEKYPHLYNVLQSAPPEEIIQRVNEDRLRTTYQTDYRYMDENPLRDYEDMHAPAGTTLCPNSHPHAREILPILDCRGRLRPPEDYSEAIHAGSDRFGLPATNGPGAFENGRISCESGLRDCPYGTGANGDIASVNRYRDTENGFKDSANVRSRHENGHREFGDDSSVIKNDAGGRRETTSRENRSRPGESTGAKAMNGRPSYGGQGDVSRGDKGAARGQVGDEGRKGGNGGETNRGRGPESAPGVRETEGRGVGGVVATRGSESGRGGLNGGGTATKTTGASNTKEAGEVKSKKMKKALEDEEASKKPLPPWSSEYQEVIGQTGMSIIKDKMHQHGGRSSGRSFIERVIMKCRT